MNACKPHNKAARYKNNKVIEELVKLWEVPYSNALPAHVK